MSEDTKDKKNGIGTALSKLKNIDNQAITSTRPRPGGKSGTIKEELPLSTEIEIPEQNFSPESNNVSGQDIEKAEDLENDEVHDPELTDVDTSTVLTMIRSKEMDIDEFFTAPTRSRGINTGLSVNYRIKSKDEDFIEAVMTALQTSNRAIAMQWIVEKMEEAFGEAIRTEAEDVRLTRALLRKRRHQKD